MVRLRRLSCSFRMVPWAGIGLVGVMAMAGCGEAGKPTVKPGDAAATYAVPPPPEDPANPKAGKSGGMSARELRDFKAKKQGQP